MHTQAHAANVYAPRALEDTRCRHACGASPPCTAYRMSAVARETECFCCSSSYMSSGSLIKNIARYHSYFMGHLHNELSAYSRLCQRACMRVYVCARPCVGGLKLPMTGEMLPPSPFSHFVFPLSICQDHMTAT